MTSRHEIIVRDSDYKVKEVTGTHSDIYTSDKVGDILDGRKPLGSDVTIYGWVKQMRLAQKGKLMFLHIGDTESPRTLQIVYDIPTGIDLKITYESSIKVKGKVCKSKSKQGIQEIEIVATLIELVGECGEGYPFLKSKEGYSIDYIRQFPHMRPRTTGFQAVLRIRAAMFAAVHSFMEKQGFIFIHTPILSTIDAEGAGECFTVISEKDPFYFGKTKIIGEDGKDKFIPKKVSLTVSGQIHLEPFACALKRVYAFGPTFRAEQSTTSRHLAEFAMFEPEMMGTLQDVIHSSMGLIKHIGAEVSKKCPLDLKFLEELTDLKLIERTTTLVEQPFAEITYTEAVELLQKSGRTFDKPSTWGVDFSSEQERYICEVITKRPTYITHYPAAIKAFYMHIDNPEDKDRMTVASTDLLMPGIGEVIGGSQRESRYQVLKDKMDGLGLDYPQYLDTRRFGTIPHAGYGLGFDRLLRYITGTDHICDVVPYHIRYEQISA